MENNRIMKKSLSRMIRRGENHSEIKYYVLESTISTETFTSLLRKYETLTMPLTGRQIRKLKRIPLTHLHIPERSKIKIKKILKLTDRLTIGCLNSIRDAVELQMKLTTWKRGFYDQRRKIEIITTVIDEVVAERSVRVIGG